MDEKSLYLPPFSHFQGGNIWTGSRGALNYRVELAEDRLKAEAWTLPLSSDLARARAPEEIRSLEAEAGEEGLAAIRAWLLEKGDACGGQPRC